MKSSYLALRCGVGAALVAAQEVSSVLAPHAIRRCIGRSRGSLDCGTLSRSRASVAGELWNPGIVTYVRASQRTDEMAQRPLAAIPQTLRGIGAAIRAEPKVIWGVTAAVCVFNLVVPVLVLSLVRNRADYFTFNPWLSRLPEYLLSEAPLSRKLSFPSNVARPAGVAGALTSVFGLTTGPCTLAGCGVPVLPVIGLAFTGLSSATLNFFTLFSRISIVVVLAAMSVAVAWFGWRAGTTRVGGLLQSS